MSFQVLHCLCKQAGAAQQQASLTLGSGMAKAVADVNGDDQGGYASDGSNITGFSHMHDSGTGGVSSLLLVFWF